MNFFTRLIGDVFGNLQKRTADRIIKKIKAREFPPDVIKNLEKLKKDREELQKKIEKYNKDAERFGLDKH